MSSLKINWAPSSTAAEVALRRAKPLFIPLKTEYYEAFERGEKPSELRRCGAAFNPGVCFVGREVVLSKGYGKKNRMKRVIIATVVMNGNLFPDEHKAALSAIYGNLDQDFIEIFLEKPLLLL